MRLRTPAKAGLLLALCGAAGLFAYALTGSSGPARAACADPVGYAGDQIYNSAHKVMQYCNAANKWIPMWGNSTGGSSGSSVSECEENGGGVVGGACWFLGALDENCDTVCLARNGYNIATRDFAGSGGSDANCVAVLDALNIGTPGDPVNSPSPLSMGCTTTNNGVTRWRHTSATTSTSNSTSYRRACACNYSVNSATSCSMTVADSDTSAVYLEELIDMATDESGGYLYALGKMSNSIVGYTIADPANIAKVDDHIDATNLYRAGAIAVKGGYAYVALTDSASISVYAVNNGTIGALADTLSLPNQYGIFDLEIVGTTLFATSVNNDSIAAVNIATPSNISLTSTLVNATHMDGAAGFEIVGNYAYIANSISNKLTVVNISNPASMSVAGNVTGTAMTLPYDVAIKGNYAYVTGGSSNSVTAFNISNPAAPVEVGKVVDAAALNYVARILIDGNTAYVTSANSDNVAAIDIASPATMAVKGSLTAAGMDYMRGIALSNGHVFAGSFAGDTLFSLTGCEAGGGGGGGGGGSGQVDPQTIVNGSHHSCGIATDNKAYCWGNNGNGKLGDGTTSQRTSPVVVLNGVGPGTYKQLSAGHDHTCGIGTDDKAYCWGSGGSGRLGDGNTAQQTSPVLVLNGVGPGTYKQISAGTGHTCGIGTDDKAYCWGSGSGGILGNNNTGQQTSPVLVLNGASSGTFKQISAGQTHTCAVGTDDKVYCWGMNGDYQLADGTQTQRATPILSATGVGPGTYKVVRAANYHTCGLGTDDKSYCWGKNDYGQVGDGTTVGKQTPTLSINGQGPGTYKKLYTGVQSDYTCGIGTDDKAYCWGKNDQGMIGDNSTTNPRTSARLVLNGASSGTFKNISTGYYHTCALGTDDKAYCWGGNNNGQIGNTTTTGPVLTPSLVVNGAGPGNYLTPADGSTTSECEDDGGKVVGGACWYLGAANASCTTTCGAHGGYNAATLSYAGSGGSNANCGAVLDAVGGMGTGASSDVFSNAAGCYTTMLGARSRGGVATTEAATISGGMRACACNRDVTPVSGGGGGGPSSGNNPETRCAAAAGEFVSNACWFLSAANKNCADACDNVFGLYDDATLSVAGSGAPDNTACTSVLTALGAPGTGSATTVASAAGCHVNGTTRRRGTTATTDLATGAGIVRACACKVGGDDLGNHTAAQDINMNNNRIVNLGAPTANTDIATKGYVDSKTGATETDPQVGALTADKWCYVTGGVLVCDQDQPGGGVQEPNSVIAVYQKAKGADGGTPGAAATWNAYPLNMFKRNNLNAFLVNNGVQLAAGTYYIDATLSFVRTGALTTRLMSSLSGTPLIEGMSVLGATGGAEGTKAYLRGLFTLNAQGIVTVQYNLGAAEPGIGLGQALDQGPEIYGTVYIEKVD